MKRTLVFALLLLTVAPGVAQLPVPAKPKVRAVTAFVRISPKQFQAELAPALRTLRAAQSAFQSAGYEVETIRVTTQPLAELTAGMNQADALAFLSALDDFSVKEQFLPNVGPATPGTSADLLARALTTLPNIEGSMIIGDANGIHWDAVRSAAHLVKFVADNSPHSQGTFNFTATAMLGPYAPFFPGSYHAAAGKQFSIGFEGAGLVAEVFARHREYTVATSELTRALTEHALAANRIGEQIARQTGWQYMGVDMTPAPLAEVSIATAIENFTGAPFGSSGTMTAASLITQAVKQVPTRQVGYSGLMVPVMEDKVLAQRWAEGRFNIDSLLAYSAVCGTGLDTVPLPGDVSEEQLARIFGDVASLAIKWNKPLSARLQPVAGKKAGDRTDFNDPYLFNTVLQKLP